MTTPASETALMVSKPAEREIRAERVFAAARDRVWRAFTDPGLVAQWWGRGNPLVIERMDIKPGGHWRYVEHAADGTHGFEGRYREVAPPGRIVRTFDWDGRPGHVSIETTTLDDLGDGRTMVTTTLLFHTAEERDDLLSSGMADGLAESYAALGRALARPAQQTAAPAAEAEIRASCEQGYEAATGDVGWEVPDLRIIVRDDIAITWGLNRMWSGPAEGDRRESWSRGTRIFQRIDGQWKMIHQHVSFPFDPATRQARTDLTP